MKKAAFIVSVSFTLLSSFFLAQDIHFSQYYLSPLSLNPANTGNYKGDYRFFGNYRSQWRDIDKAYNTFSAGGDANFYPMNQQVSGGLLFINDRSGGNLVVTKIMPSLAIHKKLAGFQCHLGVQPGLVIKTIDFYAHSFPEQLNWNTGKFDNSLPNSETNVNQRFSYFDMNVGFGINRRFGKWEPEVGLAFFHLNTPKETFIGNAKRLPIRQIYNAGLTYYLHPVFNVKAYTMCGYTTKASDWVSGINGEYIFNKNAYFTNSVFAGVMWRDGLKRNSDAAITTIGLNYANYTIGFSYDITLSQLKTAVDRKGAFEVALIYKGKNTRLSKKAIPCERY